jgi:hypothetical protein
MSRNYSSEIGRKVLEGQASYGVVAFGTRNLDWVVDTIRRQKEHHAAGRMEERLERITEMEAAQANAGQAP